MDSKKAILSVNELFKCAMRRLASTVTIATVCDAGEIMGMTATAVTSLSTDPASLLICINRSASIHGAISLGRTICVNILSEHHDALSSAFGGRAKGQDRFAEGIWHMDADGTPFLDDAQANIFCTVDALFDYATHTIVVCKVGSVLMHGEVSPLIYGDGRFVRIQRHIKAEPNASCAN